MPTDAFGAPHATTIHLRAAGVSVLLAVPRDGLPVVAHWGADVGALTAQEAADLLVASLPQTAPSSVDAPRPVSLLPEPHHAWSGRPGLSGSRAGADWATDFTVHTAALDGAPVELGGGHTERDHGGRLEVDAVDEQTDLRLTLEVELLPSGLLRSRATLLNTGEEYALDDLVLAYPVPGHARELLDFGGRWGKEKTPQRSVLHTGTHLREGRRGRTGADAAGMVHLGEAGFGFRSGAIWAVHVGFSGNHTHYAERTSAGVQVAGGGELLLPGEVRLARGESYASPWVYGSYGVGLDAVAGRIHAWLRSRPGHVDVDRPVTLNVWEAVYFDHDLDRLRDLADRAAALGVERYVLDDGWFGSRRDDFSGLGDWVVSPDAWPDGLGPLVDHVTGLGMQFGLWFEPEMVNEDSDVARAHPEWIMAARRELPPRARHQQVLDLAIEECWTYVRDAMDAILTEYDISYIKWDHNRDLVEAGNRTDHGRPAVHAQTLAYYRLVDDLKARHPGLEIESCSSGGARVDLRAMERCDRVWTSDCIDPLERQQMNRWTMQLLPPELLGSHVASGRSHTTGRVHDLSFRAGTAVLGHFGIEWDLAKATPAEIDELRSWIAYYRGRRAQLLGGDLVRVDTADDTLNVYGVVSPDQRDATFFAATTGRSDVAPRPRLLLPGLDPGTRYRVQPVVVGATPSGLRPPPWWRVQDAEGASTAPSAAGGPRVVDVLSDTRLPGGVFTGAALAAAGLQSPLVDPDQVVLYEVAAL
ncbi:alpha-galactosidase [Agilicoccus flavus]|uniref:alpha-galactosidase n=1 Tax=Agilicoccus flavus TaxID=2775968 RepID=UPI001CF667AC|nr:alpha-galactosidase [Agilicoccus flavus]